MRLTNIRLLTAGAIMASLVPLTPAAAADSLVSLESGTASVTAWTETAGGAGVLQNFPPDTNQSLLPRGVVWGAGDDGQIGNDSTADQDVATEALAGTALDGKEVSAMDMGGYHVCAIAETKLYCWGRNDEGQLGINTQVDSKKPVQVKGVLDGKKVTAVSAGDTYTCAVANARVYCWGDNSYGQLGDNSNTMRTVPVAVNTGVLGTKKVTAVAAGPHHTCAIAAAKAYCWGSNFAGSLGIGNANPSKVPVAVNTGGALKDKPVSSIDVGDKHSCALALGEVFCWGLNDDGQLGNKNNTTYMVPQEVYTGGLLKNRTIQGLATGWDTTCVIASRAAYCWGSGEDGRLGNGGDANKNEAVKVSTPGSLSGKYVYSISVNDDGGCLVADSTGYCWGDNLKTGRLGTNSSPQTSNVPVPLYTAGVLKNRTLINISADYLNSAAIAVTTPKFDDVATDSAFYHDISWIAGTGTSRGTGKLFKPSDAISRGAMAAFLFRYANPGLDDPKCGGNVRKFTDVPASNPFCGSIEYLVTAGITKVPGDKKFAPASAVERSVMAVWLYRTFYPGVADLSCNGVKPFTDVSAGLAGCGSIKWVADVGISTGSVGGVFNPGDPVTRQAMSAFMHRMYTLTPH